MIRKLIVCTTLVSLISALGILLPEDLSGLRADDSNNAHTSAAITEQTVQKEKNTETIVNTSTIKSIPVMANASHETQNRILSPIIDPKASAISVSSVKIVWNAEADHIYTIKWEALGNDAAKYKTNIRIRRVEHNSCYITGLRENSKYSITVTDMTDKHAESVIVTTEKVKILEEYEYIPGWTNCFAYEYVTDLINDPSRSAIEGAITDPVTETGIMRNEYGDYCVAMGLFYGRCGDRFLIELENGTQFTVKICDSKGRASDGEGKYHYFGKNHQGKCIVEFIVNEEKMPENAKLSGNYGKFDYDGLIFDDIKTVYRIEYGNTVVY